MKKITIFTALASIVLFTGIVFATLKGTNINIRLTDLSVNPIADISGTFQYGKKGPVTITNGTNSFTVETHQMVGFDNGILLDINNVSFQGQFNEAAAIELTDIVEEVDSTPVVVFIDIQGQGWTDVATLGLLNVPANYRFTAGSPFNYNLMGHFNYWFQQTGPPVNASPSKLILAWDSV